MSLAREKALEALVALERARKISEGTAELQVSTQRKLEALRATIKTFRVR